MLRSLALAGLFLIAPGIVHAEKSDKAPTQPQLACAAYDTMVGILMIKYGEKPMAGGTITGVPGPGMQIFVNPTTWTYSQILITAPGQACIVFAGKNFAPLKMPGVAS